MEEQSLIVGKSRFSRAFSLVEGLVVMGILAILAVIAFKYSTGYFTRAEGVRCAQNLRSLHVIFSAYIQDVGHWPQEPQEFLDDVNDDASEDWWLNELKNYGATQEVWTCPSIKRLVSNKSSDGRPKVHYTATPFDERPSTPYRWSTQPWFIEIGAMHGRGAMMCFPDGSIRTMNEVVPPRTP